MAALCAPLIALGANSTMAAEPSKSFAQELLALHNAARDEAGVPRLAWSGKLAEDAQKWADRLARDGRLYHASEQQSGGQGENLWRGSKGYYGPEEMIGAFVDEKRHYVHAAFPEVSRTGRWQDVGHYTQVVWRNTQQVGCALARGEREDFLVCRYWPAGNWRGQLAY